jgi:hypothetical protein
VRSKSYHSRVNILTAVRVGLSGCEAIRLLACCPRMPTDVVAGLLGMRHTRSAAQLLLGLRSVGLVEDDSPRLGPPVGAGRARLWTLTPAGRSFVDARGLAPSEAEIDLLPFGTPNKCPVAAPHGNVQLLVAAYRLLVHWMQSSDSPVGVVG